MKATPSIVFTFVLIAFAWAAPVLAAEQVRPGPTLVVRDKGIDEPGFVPPRSSGSLVPLEQVSTFNVTYNGFSTEAQTAFQAAVNVASQLMVSPVVIRVQANWAPLDENVLGNARANFIRRDFAGAPEPGVWYVDALADALRGFDLGGGGFDIIATFNSDYDDWYFGTDGNTPLGRIDFMSVVLHELCHGLGFIGSADVEAGQGSWGVDGFPIAFDLFAEDSSGSSLIDTQSYPNPSVDLADLLESNALYWGGPLATAANNGSRPRLYAPSTWESGSSFSHLNESSYPSGSPNSLMTPFVARGEAIHDPGPITLCLYEDTGWNTSQLCSASDPSVYWIATAANASGSQGSQWRTSLGLLNRADDTATAELRYHRTGGSIASAAVSIPASGQLQIDDVVGFLGSAGTGPLEVISDRPLAVGSRTYNVSADGTFGQFLDGIAPEDALSTGQTVTLIMLQQNPAFRSNIGFTNSGASTAGLRVDLYDGSGHTVTSFSVTLSAGANKQENQPFLERGGRNDILAGFAVVRVITGSGVQVYGSVIDNLSNDPTTIPPK